MESGREAVARKEKAEESEDLRYERNRFVAFAFASADAFLETDVELQVLYATGAVKSLIGIGDDAIIGSNLADAMIARDRARIRAMAAMAQRAGRSGPVLLSAIADDAPPLLELGVTFLPNRKGRLYFTLRSGEARLSQGGSGNKGTEAGGLLNAEDFTTAACDIAAQYHAGGGEAAITLLEITGLNDLESRLGAKGAQELMEDIAAYLQISSVDGAAARLTADRYGVVHKADLNVSALESSLAERAKSADPKGKGVSIGAQHVDLNDTELSETDLAKAVIYTITRFAENSGDLTVSDLKDSYRSMLDETRGKIAEFKRMIANQQFDVAFQPIVDLSTGAVHHYEALMRIKSGGENSSPYDTITFAEGAGVIQELDLAMCRQVIWNLKAVGDPTVAAAINLSGRSLGTPGFIESLTAMLKKNEILRQAVMFEITESSQIDDLEATNKVVQELRRLGHKVGLDDFGAGAAAFQYLNALQVDCVKIDGYYVQESGRSERGKAFLRSIVMLCSDLEIETVGEMIETREDAEYLKSLGVHYGQGYYFGRPKIGLPGVPQSKVTAA